MISYIGGAFLVLHGLVHLLYLGQSGRYFELQPGMVWPDGSWAFARVLGDTTTRRLAAVACALAALAFAAAGAGLFLQQAWWRPVAIAAALFSTALYVLFWDGNRRDLDDKGGVGILINVAIFAAAVLL